jgi:hypothetical protein
METEGIVKTQNKERTWFAGVTDPDQLKDLYRALALAYHPDRGGSTELMQEINGQYDQARKQLEAPAPSRKYPRPNPPKSNPHTSNGPSEAAMQSAVLARYFCPGVIIEIQGTEVIARGQSYENRAKLKELGFWWDPDNCYWHFVKRPTSGRKGAA